MTTYFVHPVSGSDAADGLSWATAWLSLKNKNVGGGNEVLIAKSVETPIAGTVTATFESTSWATSVDMSASLPAGTSFRVDGEDVVYWVASINATTITTIKKYRGVTGPGKTISKFTRTNQATDWSNSSVVSSPSSRISFKFGVNTATNLQDGFTCLNTSTGGTFRGENRLWTDISRLNLYTDSQGLMYWQLSTFTDCGFRGYSVNYTNATDIKYCTFTRCHSETGVSMGEQNNNRYIDCVIHYPIITSAADTKYIGCVFEGTNGDLLYYSPQIDNPEFINCNIQCRSLLFGYHPTQFSGIVKFKNCLINTVLNPPIYQWSTCLLDAGRWEFLNYNQVEGDNRVWYFNNTTCHTSGQTNPPWIQYTDNTIYRTTGPSLKFVCYESAGPLVPTPIYIPAQKGKTYTVTAYLRKNSTYGSSFALPKMRLRYETGTVGSGIVRHDDEVSMTDVNDTWVQVQLVATPNFNSAMWLEFEFYTETANATIWVDDITVTH